MTHAELVEHASIWLRRKCSVVITELASSIREQPDAIGWVGSHSVLIECKTSLSDFKADLKKFTRNNSKFGVGKQRYYMAPRGLLDVALLPPGWGLIEVQGNFIKTRIKSSVFETNRDAELRLLISAIRRIGQHAPEGIAIKTYVFDNKRRATLGVVAS